MKIMRKTKIVCTLGPASCTKDVIAGMCKAGMNVARLNFSHGSHPEHQEKIDLIKKVRKALNQPVAIMLDTKGPEIRIGTFKNQRVQLVKGQIFSLMTEAVEAAQLSAVLSDFLRSLPAAECDLFLRRYWYFDSVAQIAKRFGYSESKVKMTLSRTRDKLRAYLEKEGICV